MDGAHFMKTEVIHIGKLPAARMMALVAMVLSIPFELLSSVEYLADFGAEDWGILAIFPFIYALCAFLFTLIAVWIYNRFAGKFGGIEFIAVELPGTPAEQ